MREALRTPLAEATDGVARVKVDAADPDGQTLLLWYPEAEPADDAYAEPVVCNESIPKPRSTPTDSRSYDRTLPMMPLVATSHCDLHCSSRSEAGRAAMADQSLGLGCVKHARMFFDRPDYAFVSARPGSVAHLSSAEMIDPLRRDYENATTMIFGTAPTFDAIHESLPTVEAVINRPLKK